MPSTESSGSSPEIPLTTPALPEVADGAGLPPTGKVSVRRGPMSGATWGWLLALIGCTAFVSFYELNGGAGFEPVDAWVAQTAREMYENVQHDGLRGLIIPEFCGERRMQKSPGAYWAVCLTAYLRGGTLDEASVRIPNAIAAVLLVATVFWLTRRIAGDRSAIFAGFATASSLCLLVWSHRGSADLGVATLCAMSLACLWVGSEDEPPGWRRIGFWLAGYFFAGLAMLYKMPLPLACVGLPAILYVLLRNRWRIFANWWHLVGLALFLLPWLPWVVAVIQVEDTALAKWRVEFLDRATGDMPNVEDQSGVKFYFFYLLAIAIFTMPYVLSAPSAIVRAFRSSAGINRNGQWFLLIWFFSLFAFFTAATGKETRYFLPAMPPLFAMLGCELAAFFDPRRRTSEAIDRIGLWGTIVAVPTLFAALIYGLYRYWYRQTVTAGMFTWGELFPGLLGTALLACAGAILCAWLRFRRKENAAFGVLAGGMMLMWLWAWPTVMPYLLSQAPFKDFAKQLRERLSDDQRSRLRQIAQQDPRVVWYGNVRFPRLIDQLALLAEQGGERDMEWEVRRYGEEMIEQLSRDELVLLVAGPEDYFKFIAVAPEALAQRGRTMPDVHVWFQANVGRGDRRYILFGNQPPPWDEPELYMTDKLKARLAESRAKADAILKSLLTTQPAESQP